MKYEESDAVNFSKLSALLVGVDYYNKIMKEEIDETVLRLGTAVHHYFLEYDTFFEKYAVFKENKPSHAMQKQYCELMAEQESADAETRLDCYTKVYSSKNKNKDKLEAEATKMYILYKDYIDSLKEAKNRLIIDSKDYDMFKRFESKLKAHKGAQRLLYDSRFTTYNELEIFFKYKDNECKSKIDRLVIDTNDKTVYVIDLKTHSTPSLRTNINKSFRESAEKYNYNMQQAIYRYAVMQFMINELKIDPTEFRFRNLYIVLQSNFLNTVKVFEIEEDEIMKAFTMFDTALDLYNFYNKHGFTYDKEYHMNNLGLEKMT